LRWLVFDPERGRRAANGSVVVLAFSCCCLGSPYSGDGSFPWRCTALVADEEHRLSATWTKHGFSFDGFGWIVVNCAPVDSEMFADRFELLAGSAVEESVITEPVKAAGQGVLEVAPDELHPIDLERMAFAAPPVFDRYTHVALVRAQYPGIGYRALEEVGSKVFDGVLSAAKVLHVAVPANAPQSAAPHLGHSRWLQLCQAK